MSGPETKYTIYPRNWSEIVPRTDAIKAGMDSNPGETFPELYQFANWSRFINYIAGTFVHQKSSRLTQYLGDIDHRLRGDIVFKRRPQTTELTG